MQHALFAASIVLQAVCVPLPSIVQSHAPSVRVWVPKDLALGLLIAGTTCRG